MQNEAGMPEDINRLARAMLAQQKRDCVKASGIAFIVALLVVGSSWYVNDWKEFPTSLGILCAVVCAFWMHYLLTKYRIDKGTFGANAVEAGELIEFAIKQNRR